MLDALRPLLARLAAALVTTLAGLWMGAFGEQMPADLAQHAEALLIGAMLAVYAVVHRLLSRKLNPADVAKPPVTPPEWIPGESTGDAGPGPSGDPQSPFLIPPRR